MACVQLQLPHNFYAIVENADSKIDMSSGENLYDQLHSGIFLSQKKEKFSVDKSFHANSFELYARGLSITWGDDTRYWNWTFMKDTCSDVYVEVAELLDVCWLEVKKKFPTDRLTPRTCYEVAFVIMMKDGAYGWENPVNLKLTLPTGCPIEHKANLKDKPKNQWIEIPVATFSTCCGMTGDMEISMYELGSQCKKGLVINKIVIRPGPLKK